MGTGRRRIGLREFVALLGLGVIAGLIALPLLKSGTAVTRPGRCIDNLRQWGQVFAQYSDEAFNWQFPPVHGVEPFAKFVDTDSCDNYRPDFDYCPELPAIFPEYANDFGMLACPAAGAVREPRLPWGSPTLDDAKLGILRGSWPSPCAFEGHITNGDACYTYLGYCVDRADDDDPAFSLTEARAHGLPASGPKQVVAVLTHLDEKKTPGHLMSTLKRNSNSLRHISVSIPRLSQTWGEVFDGCGNKVHPSMVERLFRGWHMEDLMRMGSTDPPEDTPPPKEWWAETPIMWDTIYRTADGAPRFAHSGPDGVNVLFLDGHVEFQTYPGKFPVSKAFVRMQAVE